MDIGKFFISSVLAALECDNLLSLLPPEINSRRKQNGMK
jgi:hypothetical protein